MKAIIFDMDGTMFDNMMVHHRAWQKKLQEYDIHLTIEEVKAKIHGVNVEIIEREFPGRFTDDEKVELANGKEATYREIYAPEIELLPGLAELFHELKRRNIPMGVGSAAPPENVEFVLNTLDLWHYFDAIKHADDVQKGKPNPEVFLKVAEELGIDPSECVIFEDTPTGAKAAENAGAKVILVTTTHPKEEFETGYNITRFISDFTEVTVEELLDM